MAQKLAVRVKTVIAYDIPHPCALQISLLLMIREGALISHVASNGMKLTQNSDLAVHQSHRVGLNLICERRGYALYFDEKFLGILVEVYFWA